MKFPNGAIAREEVIKTASIVFLQMQFMCEVEMCCNMLLVNMLRYITLPMFGELMEMIVVLKM